MMNMLSLHSLGINIVFHADSALADFWQLSINVESKGSKLTDVNGVTRAEGIVEVSNETSPDDQHLSKNLRVTLSDVKSLPVTWPQEAFGFR